MISKNIHFKTRERRRERGLLDEVDRCSKCDQPNDRPRQRYCAACNSEYQREWKRSRIMVLRETLTPEQRARMRDVKPSAEETLLSHETSSFEGNKQ